jgi:hypothetical protein
MAGATNRVELCSWRRADEASLRATTTAENQKTRLGDSGRAHFVSFNLLNTLIHVEASTRTLNNKSCG